ncbi:FtsB family cell division protein [Granulicella sibirica]|uniref:Cell division protein DivIC (FtsB), stabilizes FtsL against RasP cleavage n=1 Tax=Granulicella sibirica TaxID=2479048 RepID=A0A4Q0SXH8_9BACT|nr:septum formation initiator family protein [Granulicella sibirica]RXH55557.1 Cell division protein DivIC (FtsB), stabilizes FtsL against RasP cleavage [Granulicella sibirica]
MSSTDSSWARGRFAQSLKHGALKVYTGRRKVATVTAAVLAIGLGYHVVFGHNGLIVYKQKRDEAISLENQLQALRRENDGLKDHTERLQSDPNAIEHQAREELHYTRPGEVIFTLPSPPPAEKQGTGSASNQ